VARHTIFGALAREEYVNMNLRHAELHLSYFVPETNARTTSPDAV
jgi:hypothetical protein